MYVKKLSIQVFPCAVHLPSPSPSPCLKEGRGFNRVVCYHRGMIVPDQLNRRMHDLRVSVTDRCNFRCTYCMPKEIFGPNYQFVARQDLLTYEECARLVGIFVDHGVRKVRITGGEPLLRRDLHRLVSKLAAIGDLTDLTLTTNGLLLGQHARDLKEAGLQRVTVSLDSGDDNDLWPKEIS